MTSASTLIGIFDVSAPLPFDPLYTDDPQIVLKIEQQICKVHRYFLVRESEFFRDMFSLPQGDSARVEGTDDKHPLCIPNTTIAEFRSLFRFFYFGMHDDYAAPVKDWIATLTISTRLVFPKVRERAIKELTPRLEEIDPFDLIRLATKYDVERWLKPTYRRIVTRTDLIIHAEAEKIPLLVFIMLTRAREQFWKYPKNSRLVDNVLDPEIRLMDQDSRELTAAGKPP